MIDTAALREKVLDLAIRGKLVPQDPTDEPASVLLERIHEQKLQMVREGKLKAKDVKDDTIIFKGDDNCYYEKYSDGSVKNIQDEIPFDLPVGWAWSRIGTSFITVTGNTPSTKDSTLYGGDFPFYKPSDLDNGIRVESARDTVSKKGYLCGRSLPELAVLVTCIGATIGKTGLIRKVGICNQQINAILPNGFILSEYMYYVICSNYEQSQIIARSAATTLPIINKGNFDRLLIPIAPILEQKQIIETINEIFALVSTIEKESSEINLIKTLLKSKILELAIQGKLVPQVENDEPASVLLERIRAERKAKLGKKYVESYIFKGDDNCYYENNVNNPVEIPFVLPKNWAFSRLEEVAWLEDSIKSLGEELPYLDVKTIRGKQNATMLSSGKIIEKGMQVILVDGENSGEVFEVPCRGYMGSTFRILKVSSYVGIDYIRLILDYYKNLFKDNKTGSAIPHLNKKIFKSLIIGIPPIEEQKAIVNRVKSVAYILKDGD